MPLLAISSLRSRASPEILSVRRDSNCRINLQQLLGEHLHFKHNIMHACDTSRLSMLKSTLNSFENICLRLCNHRKQPVYPSISYAGRHAKTYKARIKTQSCNLHAIVQLNQLCCKRCIFCAKVTSLVLEAAGTQQEPNAINVQMHDILPLHAFIIVVEQRTAY